MIDYTSHPKRTIVELDKSYPPNLLLIMEDVLKTRKTFEVVYQDLIDMMKYGFEKESVRKRPIFFKFKKSDKKTHQMQLNHFISSMIFWAPLIDIDKVDILDESWIFDFAGFNADSLQEYVNDKILPIYDMDFASQNIMVDELYHHIICISQAFCLLMSMGVSIYDLHQLELRNPEVSHLMRDPVDTSLEPHEVEQLLSNRTKRLIDLLVEDPMSNDYKPFFASKTALKAAQFREYVVRIGYKADINGNTVPILIDNNFMMDGLSKPSFVYLNAISGRKALILSKLNLLGHIYSDVYRESA